MVKPAGAKPLRYKALLNVGDQIPDVGAIQQFVEPAMIFFRAAESAVSAASSRVLGLQLPVDSTSFS